MRIIVCVSISGSKVSDKKHVCLKQSCFISKDLALQTAVPCVQQKAEAVVVLLGKRLREVSLGPLVK